MINKLILLSLIFLCSGVNVPYGESSAQHTQPDFYFGADLSYVNEMEDCGAIYYEDGVSRDVFELMAEHGANLIRARLWHRPDWTSYSTLADVKRTLQRAEAQNMNTLLALHYSDTWADVGHQDIPAAWQDLTTIAEMNTTLYNYTYDVLRALLVADLVPDFVQVGNEINAGLLKEQMALDWSRDSQLIRAGIRAIHDFNAGHNQDVQIILHVAQPENTTWWFREAEAAGVTDFDVIGISYYPQWSSFSIAEVGHQVAYLRDTFGKEVLIVETAYPWTLDSVADTANNILGMGLADYPINPQGQKDYLVDLSQTLLTNGALGVIYWEPAWISTDCYTQWGQGSHWENATFFDFRQNNELLPAIDYMAYPYAN